MELIECADSLGRKLPRAHTEKVNKSVILCEEKKTIVQAEGSSKDNYYLSCQCTSAYLG